MTLTQVNIGILLLCGVIIICGVVVSLYRCPCGRRRGRDDTLTDRPPAEGQTTGEDRPRRPQ